MSNTMCNRDKLLHMFEYACSQELCKNRRQFAIIIGISEKNLSNALSTNEKVSERFCTNGLLNKANAALNYAFSQQWIQDGIGEMFANNNNVQAHIPTQAHTRALKHTFDDDDIDYLRHRIKELEKFNASLLRLNQLLEKEIEQLKKGNVSARAN